MTPDLIDYLLFIILALVSVAAALGMLFSHNAVYAALYLILNFVSVAVFYLILGGAFIAITQVAVYAGAIMVLFLFVIMLLGTEKLGQTKTLAWQRPLAIILGLILGIETLYMIFAQANPGSVASSLHPGFGSPSSIGHVLFTQYLLPFEITSVLLLVAMVGAIVLSKREQ